MSDLGEFLLRKSKQKILESSFATNPLEMKSVTSTPTKQCFVPDDYSPGSEYWTKAVSSSINSPEILKSASPRKEKIVDFQPLKTTSSSSSVANLLKRMKGNEFVLPESSESELAIDSIEQTSNFCQERDKKLATNILIEAIHGLELRLELQRKEVLNLLKSDKVNQDKPAITIGQIESLLEKKLASLEAVYDEKRNEGKLKRDLPENSTQQTILQELKLIQSIIRESQNPIDRPTKAIISAMNDKLVHISKLQEHEFSHQLQKLSLIEKKLSRPTASAADQSESLQDIMKIVVSIDSHIGRFERQQQSDNVRLEKLLKLSKSKNFQDHSSEEEPFDKDEVIRSQLNDLKRLINNDQKLTEERMSQFMNMFSILQTAHLQLLAKLEKLENNSSKIEKINQTLATYLPLNLESKLLFIERELKSLKK